MAEPRDPDPDILTVGEVARLLRVSVDTVRREAAKGLLPARRVGREWRFHRQALLKWLDSHDDAAASSADNDTDVSVEVDVTEAPCRTQR